MTSSGDTQIIAGLNVSEAGAVVWEIGHEGSHSLGVDVDTALYPHLKSEIYGLQAYRNYKQQTGRH